MLFLSFANYLFVIITVEFKMTSRLLTVLPVRYNFIFLYVKIFITDLYYQMKLTSSAQNYFFLGNFISKKTKLQMKKLNPYKHFVKRMAEICKNL